MLIQLSYYMGENSTYKYFESYEVMVKFIKKYLEIEDSDSNHFDVWHYRGKEEERIRGLGNVVVLEGEQK